MDLETKALSRSKRACRDLRGRQSSLRLPMGTCIAVMAIQVPAADIVIRTMRGPIAHCWSPRSPWPVPEHPPSPCRAKRDGYACPALQGLP